MAGRGFHVSVLSYCRFFTVEAVFRRGYGLRVKVGAMVPDGYNGTELKDPSLTAGPVGRSHEEVPIDCGRGFCAH
jgi:hypothetical protein